MVAHEILKNWQVGKSSHQRLQITTIFFINKIILKNVWLEIYLRGVAAADRNFSRSQNRQGPPQTMKHINY